MESEVDTCPSVSTLYHIPRNLRAEILKIKVSLPYKFVVNAEQIRLLYKNTTRNWHNRIDQLPELEYSIAVKIQCSNQSNDCLRAALAVVLPERRRC